MSHKMICIYHANCTDGFCAAWLWHRRYPDAEFIPASYGDVVPPDVYGADVVVLDFSYPRFTLERMRQEAHSLLVLDHHKTAEAELRGLDYCQFDMTRSGAKMTYDYLSSPPEVGWLVRYVQDRDLWQFKLPESRAVNAAIRSYPMTFAAWDQLTGRDPMMLIAEGRAILRAQDQVIAASVASAVEMTIAGHPVLCCNATAYISEIGNELARGRTFSAVWRDDGLGRRAYSLRSSDTGLDVSEIARQFGGGHRNAAGFSVPSLLQPTL